MKKSVFNKVKSLCSHLIQKPFVKVIWIYGSSVKKKGNDTDVLILVDDTIKGFNINLRKLESKIEKIKRKTKLNLHFQSPMRLSKLWSLIIKGEPWIITSLKNPLIIYDDSDYLSLIKKLIRKKHVPGKDIKSERLVARSEEFLTDNRELMLSLVEELFFAATEAAQIFLIIKEKIIYEPRKLLKELNKYTNTNTYFEILDLNEKANKGALSEFTGEDLDYYSAKIKKFIDNLEKLSLQEKKNDKKI
ncbi:MAG: hypothetical protein KJ559_01090 [Nanoarchaeota archaeon]|nr:hypothetical protein [Nanoarchaeota archaeon]